MTFVPDRNLVSLRALNTGDVDNIMSWVNDPNIVGNIAAFSGQAFSKEEELVYVEKMIASAADEVFSIFETRPGAYVGQVGIHQIHQRSRVARLGMIIGGPTTTGTATKSQPLMGRGLGSAALACAIDHAFAKLSLHKLWLMVFFTNLRSLRTYERLGFIREGLLREEYFHQTRSPSSSTKETRADWHDMIRLGLLQHEWVLPPLS